MGTANEDVNLNEKWEFRVTTAMVTKTVHALLEKYGVLKSRDASESCMVSKHRDLEVCESNK